jgi:Phage P22-like portal protein
MSDLDREATLSGDRKILAQVKRHFKQCEDWEQFQRKLFLDDVKFANADSDNGYQWPNDIYNRRDNEDRPSLTINKTRQHNLQIINDAKQNKPTMKFRPAGGGATFKSAQILEGLARHTEYISNATDAYDTATTSQVEGGIGYWRVITDFADNETFDKEIYIRRVQDALTVYLDPDINEIDGSDAMFGMIFRDRKRDVWNEENPEYKNIIGTNAFDMEGGWIDEDHIRECEYYYKELKKKKLVAWKTDPDDPASEVQTYLMEPGEIPSDILKPILDLPSTRTREVFTWTIWHCKIAGDMVIDKKIWPGIYIPIVRLIGEETIINGILDRKGHTRALKDPQRMYNYFSSAAVEFTALQTKAPWVAPARALEGHEGDWANANTENPSVLVYNDIGDDGQPIAPPQRPTPPTPSQGYLQAMETARQEMMMVSGQYEATMGQKSNEVSGKAINERARGGETANYHFIDNEAIAIRFTAKILLDLYPKIYDTQRIKKILAEDGTETNVMIDPQAEFAHQEASKAQSKEISAIFNPNVGKYDVYCDVGPAFATRRQEAWNAITQIVQKDSALMPIIGDLLFKSADFPNADKIAERLYRMVPAQALGTGASPAQQQTIQQLTEAQAQVKHLGTLLENTLRDLAEEKSKLKSKDSQKDIDVYEAITRRIVALEKHLVTPKDNAEMLHDLMKEEHKATLAPVVEAAAGELKDDSDDNNVAPATP